jgi:hypothetical protein
MTVLALRKKILKYYNTLVPGLGPGLACWKSILHKFWVTFPFLALGSQNKFLLVLCVPSGLLMEGRPEEPFPVNCVPNQLLGNNLNPSKLCPKKTRWFNLAYC